MYVCIIYIVCVCVCRHGFENRERTASTPLATPHNKEPVQIVREFFLLLCFSRRWRTHGYQTTNTDNGRRTTDTETRRDNRIYYSEGVQRGQDEQVCTNGDRRRCSRMYAGVENSAAACTTTQQHVQQRDTKAATCTTKSYTCNRMYYEETQAQPHVQHSPTKKRHPLLWMEVYIYLKKTEEDRPEKKTERQDK